MSGHWVKADLPPQGLRLLALDGGGVRGLSPLLILEQLMERIDPVSPPKPCDYFDLIGGTSTGGLIALMLGRMRMSIEDAKAAYEELSPRIFTKQHHRWTMFGQVQGRFSHEELEKGVIDMLAKQGLHGETLLQDLSSPSCRTFVCAMSGHTRKTVVLSSYYSKARGRDLWTQARVWQCARATAAATTFFEPITISNEQFLDGALGANNPVQVLAKEARNIWGTGEKWRLEDNLRCLVSIGTGVPSIEEFGKSIPQVADSLVKIATDCDDVHQAFMADHPEMCKQGEARLYYRFSVPRGMGDIGLESTEKIGAIIATTRLYLSLDEVGRELDWASQRLDAGQYKEASMLQNLVEDYS